jgi:hypothetical protein
VRAGRALASGWPGTRSHACTHGANRILGARTGVDVDARIRSQRSSASTDLAVKPGAGTWADWQASHDWGASTDLAVKPGAGILETPDRCWRGVSVGRFRRQQQGFDAEVRNLFALREHMQDPESMAPTAPRASDPAPRRRPPHRLACASPRAHRAAHPARTQTVGTSVPGEIVLTISRITTSRGVDSGCRATTACESAGRVPEGAQPGRAYGPSRLPRGLRWSR